MHWIFIFLNVYILTQVISAEDTYCRFTDLQNFLPNSQTFKPINPDDYNYNCLKFPTFNATIIQSTLHVEGCESAEYTLNTNAQWKPYKTPVTLTNGQSVRVRCGSDISTLLINPPTFEKPAKAPSPSKNPSVFVVMIDAVSYEALHRLMPNTVAALKEETDVDVYEFTKYSTVGLNSNPNKFALFGRHEYRVDIRNDPSSSQLTWLWDHAKKLGYTTVIAEDECPREDSVWDLMNVHTKANKMDPAEGPDYVLLDQVCVENPHPNKYCIQNRWGFEYVPEYVSGMLNNFEQQDHQKPIFMWSNFIDAHEPEQWAAPLMDTTVVNYLHSIIKSKFMDNGVILFVSDHGIHFGDFAYSSYLGSAENKHPFLYVMAKKGVLDDEIVRNNQDKLVTPTDLFQTLSNLIGHGEIKDMRDIDIFHDPVPADRTCDMAGIQHPWCMCSYGTPKCTPKLPYDLWEVCQSRYAHPRFFDWQYYATHELKPRYNMDFDECDATAHWCSFGLSLGWNGTSNSQSSIREYVAQSPFYSTSHSFCWNWPTDCNWGHVMEHYFTEGFLSDFNLP